MIVVSVVSVVGIIGAISRYVWMYAFGIAATKLVKKHEPPGTKATNIV